VIEYQVTDLSIVPLYDCNLLCDYCLFSHMRGERRVMKISFLRHVLSMLKREGVKPESISIFGGEVTLLDAGYLRELFSSIREFFPDAYTGVVTNLIDVDNGFIRLCVNYEVSIYSSCDEFRFAGKEGKRRMWETNMKRLADFCGEPPDCLVADSPNAEEVFAYLKELGVKRITLLRLFVPEEASSSIRERIIRFTMPVHHMSESYYRAVRYFNEVRLPNSDGKTIINTLLLLPEGKVVIHGPSKLGYPYEKFYEIYPAGGERSILFSEKRLEYISSFISTEPCIFCNVPVERCLAEIRYPGLCLGHV